MNRWWIVGAGALGIGLAVLLIPKADTGGEVPDLDIQVQTRAEAASRVDEGPLGATAKKKQSTPPRAPSESEKRVAQKLAARDVNPTADDYAHLIRTPEVKTANGLQAPWSDVKRKLAAVDSDEARAIASKINALNNDMARYRRNPELGSWEDFEQQQQQLMSEVRGASFHSSDLEGALQLVEQRMGMLATYQAEEAGGE